MIFHRKPAEELTLAEVEVVVVVAVVVAEVVLVEEE